MGESGEVAAVQEVLHALPVDEEESWKGGEVDARISYPPFARRKACHVPATPSAQAEKVREPLALPSVYCHVVEPEAQGPVLAG